MTVIFHIADRERWERSVPERMYTASSRGLELAEQGFIHLSTAEQLPGVASRYYAGVEDLVLLHVDPALLVAPLVYEDVPGAGTFPHLYGPMNVDAVVLVEPFSA